MNLLVLAAIVLQVVFPPLLLLWIWRRTLRTRLEWLAGVMVVASTISVLSLVMPWSVVPGFVRHAFAIATLALIVLTWRRARRLEWLTPFGRARRVILATHSALTLLMVVVLVQVIIGTVAPAGTRIDLSCPFPSGVYLVVNGGNSRLLNSHLETLQPIARYATWRGQSYGLDLIRIDHWRRRSAGLAPTDPSLYYIHGQVVTSPCGGAVVSTANDRPDMPVPVRDPDRTQLAGNHVLLDCEGTEVLLAHLLQGSVRVMPGDRVSTGQPVGVVGNSGNTTEPHLHVSAQRRAAGDALIGGTPVWITINGRYLVRNERLDCDSVSRIDARVGTRNISSNSSIPATPKGPNPERRPKGT